MNEIYIKSLINKNNRIGSFSDDAKRCIILGVLKILNKEYFSYDSHAKECGVRARTVINRMMKFWITCPEMWDKCRIKLAEKAYEDKLKDLDCKFKRTKVDCGY